MLNGERTWVLDTEANGSHPGETIELAAVEMIGFELTGQVHQWRFRPREKINYSATRVHGITNRDVAGCSPVEEYVAEISALLGGDAIAGHAVHVELNALQRFMPDWKPPQAYDTLRLVRRVFPDVERHGLFNIGGHLGLTDIAHKMTGKAPHSALYDALLSALILRKIMKASRPEDRAALFTHIEVIAMRDARDRGLERRAARVALRQAMRAKAAATATGET